MTELTLVTELSSVTSPEGSQVHGGMNHLRAYHRVGQDLMEIYQLEIRPFRL